MYFLLYLFIIIFLDYPINIADSCFYHVFFIVFLSLYSLEKSQNRVILRVIELFFFPLNTKQISIFQVFYLFFNCLFFDLISYQIYLFGLFKGNSIVFLLGLDSLETDLYVFFFFLGLKYI